MHPFEELLLMNVEKYPKMQPCDALKLAYQAEFGNSHYVGSAESSLEEITRELADTEENENTLFFEPLGKKYGRLNFASPMTRKLDPVIINRMFCDHTVASESAMFEFESKMDRILTLAHHEQLPFTFEECSEFFDYYRKRHMGEPVRHSNIYRASYLPAYRVVKARWEKLIPLIIKAQESACAKGRAIIVLEGMSASGKTTAARLLSGLLDAPVIHTDHFFLPDVLRTEARLSEYGGNFHYERFKIEVVDKLYSLEDGEEFTYRIYDCSEKKYSESKKIKASKYMIIEGSYSMHPYLGDYAGAKLFMKVTPEAQSRRILRRNGPIMHRRFVSEWIPMENAYAKHFGIEDACDYSIDSL